MSAFVRSRFYPDTPFLAQDSGPGPGITQRTRAGRAAEDALLLPRSHREEPGHAGTSGTTQLLIHPRDHGPGEGRGRGWGTLWRGSSYLFTKSPVSWKEESTASTRTEQGCTHMHPAWPRGGQQLAEPSGPFLRQRTFYQGTGQNDKQQIHHSDRSGWCGNAGARISKQKPELRLN